MLKSFLLVFLFFCGGMMTTNAAFAQTSADSLNQNRPVYADVENSFYSAIGSNSRLYNGKLYEFYDHSIQSNAYFMDINDWRPGSVVYDGYLYDKVDMLYDLFKDELVIHLYNSYLKISLISEKVKSFNLLDHHFIYLKQDAANPTSLKSGFYDVLYDGKIKVLAKRKKTIQASGNLSVTIYSYFTPTTVDYYLYKNGNYYTVNSQGEFLNVLKDRKKQVQDFIKSNKIKYRKGREEAMTMIAGYYDHLTD